MADRKIKVIQITGAATLNNLFPQTKVEQLRQSANPANGLSDIASYILGTLGVSTLETKWLMVKPDGTAEYRTNSQLLTDMGASEIGHGHQITHISMLDTALNAKVPLDEYGKIQDDYIPEKVMGAVKFLGYFSAGCGVSTLFPGITIDNWEQFQGMYMEATASIIVSQTAGWRFWVGDDTGEIGPGSMFLEPGDQVVFNQYANSYFEVAIRSNQASKATAGAKGIVTLSDPTGKTLATLDDTASNGDKVVDEFFLREVMKDFLYQINIAFTGDVTRVIESIPTGTTAGTAGDYVFCFQNNTTYLCNGGYTPNVSWTAIAPSSLPASEADGFSVNKIYYNTYSQKYLVPKYSGKNSVLIESTPMVNDLIFIQQ